MNVPEIFKNPMFASDYQREYKLGKPKESTIIEPLLLNIPIPVIYLSIDTEQEKVLLNVIYGVHRVKAMYRYRSGDYSLTKLVNLTGLEGKSYNQLSPNVKNRLDMDSISMLRSLMFRKMKN